ncbi:HEPN domain-containing protein [Candidatus Margulisiibacteriota bacterium]
MDKITRYWEEHSDYDLETARAMLKARRYLYVTFMCHQATEKLLKAVITRVSKTTPPRSHDLTKLSTVAKIDQDLAIDQRDFLVELTPFCIITRYAGYKKKLSELTNAKLAKSVLQKTEGFIKWLKRKKI